jgi:hypothetical protein
MMPLMGKPNMMPFPQMPRARVPRTVNYHQPPMPIVTDQKKPQALRIEGVEQYSTRDLGEKLYPMVLKITNQQVVGKITGMLLEMDKFEVINLINDEVVLRGRVREAVEVLKKAWAHQKENLALLPNLG